MEEKIRILFCVENTFVGSFKIGYLRDSPGFFCHLFDDAALCSYRLCEVAPLLGVLKGKLEGEVKPPMDTEWMTRFFSSHGRMAGPLT